VEFLPQAYSSKSEETIFTYNAALGQKENFPRQPHLLELRLGNEVQNLHFTCAK
jgi:hypothetical protein